MTRHFFYVDKRDPLSYVSCIDVRNPTAASPIGILLIGGAATTGSTYLFLLAKVFKRKYYTLSPDLPGHGMSGGVMYDANYADFSFNIQSCISMYRTKQISRIFVIAESFGALLWVRYATEHNGHCTFCKTCETILLSPAFYVKPLIPFQNTLVTMLGNAWLINDIQSPLLTPKIDNLIDPELLLDMIASSSGSDLYLTNYFNFQPSMRLLARIYDASTHATQRIAQMSNVTIMFGNVDTTLDLRRCLALVRNQRVVVFESGHSLLLSRNEAEREKTYKQIERILSSYCRKTGERATKTQGSM
jgi:pimeloyl-ACP methyl ester carboxylesterase